MNAKIIMAAGLLMAPVCVLGLLYHQAYIWGVCPQALAVMFIRQSLHAYDSLGAADYPDLVVATLYYPIIAWVLSRAWRRGSLGRVSLGVAACHAAAVGLAFGIVEMRNRMWGFN